MCVCVCVCVCMFYFCFFFRNGVVDSLQDSCCKNHKMSV